MTTGLVVPARFNGPARSGNGGFVCGSLAEQVTTALGEVVQVTLRRPPPLDTPMAVSERDGITVLWLDSDVDPAVAPAVDDASVAVAEARPATLEAQPVEGVPPAVAADAMSGYPGLRSHPFPTCFTCGPQRAQGDGLRIFPGPVEGMRGHVASVWVPHQSLAESGDVLDAVHRCGFGTTWAALDCVGGWSEDLEGRPCVLGRMTARVDALPVVGEPHVVVGRLLGRDGRKSLTASTLYDADGRVVASAEHVWIQVDPAFFS